MRVLIKINGVQQVDEIYENEVIGPKDIKLYTPQGLLDIVVHGVNEMDLYSINKQLLEKGYVDLSMYHAEYFDDEDEEEE